MGLGLEEELGGEGLEELIRGEERRKRGVGKGGTAAGTRATARALVVVVAVRRRHLGDG